MKTCEYWYTSKDPINGCSRQGWYPVGQYCYIAPLRMWQLIFTLPSCVLHYVNCESQFLVLPSPIVKRLLRKMGKYGPISSTLYVHHRHSGHNVEDHHHHHHDYNRQF